MLTNLMLAFYFHSVGAFDFMGVALTLSLIFGVDELNDLIKFAKKKP